MLKDKEGKEAVDKSVIYLKDVSIPPTQILRASHSNKPDIELRS